MREVILLYQIDRNPVAKSDTSSLAGLFVPLTLLCPCLPTVQPVHPCAGVRRHAAHPCATRVCYARLLRASNSPVPGECMRSCFGCPELGYVSLAELTTVRGKLGLPVERDRHFVANKPISLTPRKLGLTRTASLRGDFGRLVTRAARLHGYSKAS